MKIITYLLMITSIISCNNANPNEISIQWEANLVEDFSFTENWSYPEGIFLNKHGQLSCDGICPPEIDNMSDEKGRILDDSLEAFYNLIDTTHQFHSILSETNTPEWDGTNFISAIRVNKDTVKCITWNNTATHSSLELVIVNNIVRPSITLMSIDSSEGTKVFNCSRGKMTIDKNLWESDIIKASFEFSFYNNEDPKQSLYWKGLIYTKIKVSQRD